VQQADDAPDVVAVCSSYHTALVITAAKISIFPETAKWIAIFF
jgi:hypothetical protein